MTAEVRRRPRVGEPLVAPGWPVHKEGRKYLAGWVLWSAGGNIMAVNLAIWIVVSDEQRIAFGSRESAADQSRARP